MRQEEANGDPYGIDGSKIVFGGQGTGGYLSLGVATLDTTAELFLTKFLDLSDPMNPIPYVYPPVFGNISLIGANVIIKETDNGTATNYNGEYKIIHNGTLPTTLNISYLGYKNLDVEITTNNQTVIKLFADNKNLKEVKVVDNRITQKQKESALTVEALDMIHYCLQANMHRLFFHFCQPFPLLGNKLQL